MKLTNKVALITGAALGYKTGGPSIGSAIAFKFASEGAKVIIVDINEKMGQKTADRINESGGEALFINTDVGSTEQVQKAINITKEKFGKLHCLVNCAASYEGDIFAIKHLLRFLYHILCIFPRLHYQDSTLREFPH